MNEQLMNVVKKPWFMATAVGALSFTVGGGLGYIIGTRRVINVLTDAIEESEKEADGQMELFVEDHVGEVMNCHQDVVQEFRDLEQGALEMLREAESAAIYWPAYQMEEEAELILQDIELEDAIEEAENAPQYKNVFAANDDTWDYEVEKTLRTSGAPYIIHQDEFMTSEFNFDQSVVTYYEGDDIACDEHDEPMHDHKRRLGELRFGHGSKDSQVVYIRSERLEIEWEVLLHPGRYEIEVLGNHVERSYEEAELKHANQQYRFNKEE
jgi:hypothetical protein